MKIVVQRSNNSKVIVNNEVVGEIQFGLVLLVSFTYEDQLKDIDYMIDKIINLRIFDDENGIMNKSLLDVNGEVLSISQFTLYADTKKGRRPSYINALKGEDAVKLYDLFNEKLGKLVTLKKGIFGADMLLNIENNGPVTIILESR